ncbi:MAG: hypothetical protein LQ350_005384 [Teloschistes chrysophthalmus]|nr:MAG: hypothetical protein LQ350_005384 [Niorma chrysophthalma]
MDILEELSVLIRNKEIDPNAKEVDELTYLMNECGPSDDTVSNSDKKLDQMQIMVENWESMQFVFFDPVLVSLRDFGQ